MHVVFALILSLFAAASAAKLPVAVASRELDGVAHLSTFEQLPCIRGVPSRLETSEKLVAVQGGTPNFPRPNIGEMEEYFEKMVVSFENFTVFGKGVGTFVSVPDVAEYNNLMQGQVNNGFLNVEKRDILKIDCSNHTEEDDTVFVTFQEEMYYNYGADRVTRVATQKHVFAAGSNLLLYYESQLFPPLHDAVANNVPTPREMCNEAALRCEGEIFPYDSLQECYETLSSLPLSCEHPKGEYCYDCVDKNSPFHGDTLQCRSLHMLSAKLRPTHHCEHMANISAKCIPDQCPAFATRLSLEEVADSMTPFDASLFTWFRIVEIAVAAGFLLLPVLTFCSYRRSRMLVIGFSPPPIVKSSSNRGKHVPDGDGEEEPSHHGIDTTTRIEEDDKMDVSDSSRLLRSHKKTNDDDDLPEKLPQMRCALRLLNLIDSKDDDGDVIISADGIDVGGCKMTALTGRSGCGKSTLMKLLCNFPQSHMKLELELILSSSPCEVAYVPQSTEMWPQFMRVRDIFIFTSVMQGCNMDDYMECIKVLQLGELLDQTFQTLSGGQQQRVHILASMIRSKPSIMFLDEPISALDEENAVACLQLLKNLPVKHAFVIAIHQMSPALRVHFDRVLEIDPTTKKMRKVHLTTDSTNQRMLAPTSTDQESSFSRRHHSFFRSVKSLMYLWHSLFWSWPALDIGAIFLGVVNATILGVMGKQALESSDTTDYVPSSIGTRAPVFMVQFIANVAALSAFVVALIFSNEDRKLLAHFLQQGDILSRHVVIFNTVRFAFYSIIFATILMLVPLGIMGLVDDGIDTMIMNVAFFGTAYTYLCYVLARSVPPLYSSQILLLTFLPMTLFTGVFFPWDSLSTFFRILHYMNPLFYCLTACTHLLLATFDPNCDPHAYPYLICAAPDAIREITQLQDIGSTESQLFSAGVLLLSMGFLWLSHRHKPTHSKLTAPRTGLKRHSSIFSMMPPPMPRRRSIGVTSASSSWLATSDSVRESLGLIASLPPHQEGSEELID
jgi:ABC-type Mn2+/Zn2+ transport system ATPase subunit